MTREELKAHYERQIQEFERVEKIMPVTPNDWKRYEEHKMILELLEQNSKIAQFAIWVAKKIFDDQWEYNKDAFSELACRKLSELGIVRQNGDKWEFTPQESEASE